MYVNKQGERIKTRVGKTDALPVGKKQLIKKHYQPFIKITNTISFDKLANDINIYKPM